VYEQARATGRGTEVKLDGELRATEA